MKRINTSVLFLFLLSIFACNKFEEGGYDTFSMKNLCGAKKVGSSKKWKLAQFIVDGIDSTNLLPNCNVPDFYSFNFICTDSKYDFFEAESAFMVYSGSVRIIIAVRNKNYHPGSLDSAQIAIIDNKVMKYRNILYPEFFRNTGWKILKLKRDELIIEHVDVRKYTVKLIHK